MDANERLRRASEEAADWWAVLQGGQLTLEEREAFIDWLRDSQTNIAEMLRLTQVHGVLSHFQQWTELSTEGAESQADVVAMSSHRHLEFAADVDGDSNSRSRTVKRRLAFVTTLAAAALAAAYLLVPHFPWQGKQIATERGERRELVLEDGSFVQIDPQTRLSVRFEKSLRRVVLADGRAVFHVAKNAARPFIVEADDTTVRAVGTSFGVERRGRNVVVVTVAEGKVAVSSADSAGKQTVTSAKSAPAPTTPLYLTANQQVTVQGEGATIPVREVSSSRELAWAEGRLVFKDEPVGKVVAEFNRYNQVQLFVKDSSLAARPVTGVFNAANPEAFLAFLQSATPVRLERDGVRAIMISSDARQ